MPPPARLWHHECHRQADCAWFPDMARRYLLSRDKGRCRLCGVVVQVPRSGIRPARQDGLTVDWGFAEHGIQDWEADHMAPLWLVPREFVWWTPWNLQLLCRACHVVKSRVEAGIRNKARTMTGIEQARVALAMRRMWRRRWYGGHVAA